jgi:hypothetical protein
LMAYKEFKALRVFRDLPAWVSRVSRVCKVPLELMELRVLRDLPV